MAKASHTRYRALGPELIPVYSQSARRWLSHPPGSRLSLLSAKPAVTFPAAEHHRPLVGTKLYCLVTEAHRCEQLAHGCYAAFAPSRIWSHDLLIASPALYLLCHCATSLYQTVCNFVKFKTDFQIFCTVGKRKKFATKPIWHYPYRLRHVAALSREIKNSNFMQIWKKMQTNCIFNRL